MNRNCALSVLVSSLFHNAQINIIFVIFWSQLFKGLLGSVGKTLAQFRLIIMHTGVLNKH